MLISGSVQDVPDPDKPETWTFQVVNSWIGQRDPAMDNAARLAQIKAYASDFAEPFRSATLAMPADTIVTYDTMAYWVCIPWDNKGGRATLAGDAAHPMPPCKSSFPLRELLWTDALACRSGTGIEPCNQRQCQLRRCTTKGPERGSQFGGGNQCIRWRSGQARRRRGRVVQTELSDDSQLGPVYEFSSYERWLEPEHCQSH